MKPLLWNRTKLPSVRQSTRKGNSETESAGQTSHYATSGKRIAETLAMSGSATPKDIADCISCWLAYLQMLNGLCSAGSRLSQCLCGLAQENHIMAAHCQAMWEELVRASTVASSNIKTNVLTALQELSLADVEGDRPRSVETNQVISNSLAAFIQLQYQLCAASCECLGPVLGCPCPPDKHEADCSAEAMHQCFQRLFPPPARSPVAVTLAPFTAGCQRRWSEAAAQEVNSTTDADGTMRRWSMPWENSKVNDQQAAWPGSRLMPKSKLAVPGGGASQDRSRSTTPESACHSSMASQEELQEVIQLLSCPMPSNSSRPAGGKPILPGVILTGCGYDPSQAEMWSEGTTPSSRRGSNSPHRGSHWQSQGWTEGEAQTPSGGDGNYELSPATLDPAAIASRKSSSSTDSSSSYSLHSRSTTGSISAASNSDGQQEVRPHLYSIWSGADLPFIKLPESTETIEETPADIHHEHYFGSKPV